MVFLTSKKVLVTDPNLFEVAKKYGIKKKKIDWLCFGKPIWEEPDQKNINLKRQITAFKKQLQRTEEEKVYLGLCVSKPAKKKLHYLLADSIVGATQAPKDSVTGLVLIGEFPEGLKFDKAKQRVKKSPHILFIDDSFKVNELHISDQIDFFYRSLADQSVPYTLYVAANVKKPMVAHNYGALPLLVKQERLGFIFDTNEKDVPTKIVDHVNSWSPEGAEIFLNNRTWKVAAIQLIKAIED